MRPNEYILDLSAILSDIADKEDEVSVAESVFSSDISDYNDIVTTAVDGAVSCTPGYIPTWGADSSLVSSYSIATDIVSGSSSELVPASIVSSSIAEQSYTVAEGTSVTVGQVVELVNGMIRTYCIPELTCGIPTEVSNNMITSTNRFSSAQHGANRVAMVFEGGDNDAWIINVSVDGETPVLLGQTEWAATTMTAGCAAPIQYGRVVLFYHSGSTIYYDITEFHKYTPTPSSTLVTSTSFTNPHAVSIYSVQSISALGTVLCVFWNGTNQVAWFVGGSSYTEVTLRALSSSVFNKLIPLETIAYHLSYNEVKVALVYADNNGVYCCLYNANTDTPSMAALGSAATIFPGTASNVSAIALSPDQLFIHLYDTGSSVTRCYLIDVSGNTPSSSSAYSGTGFQQTEIGFISGDTIIAVYEDTEMYCQLYTIDTGITIQGSAHQLHDDDASARTYVCQDIHYLSQNKFLITHPGYNGPCYMTVVSFAQPQFANVVGVAAESKTAGESCSVIRRGYLGGLSGLITGSTYYATALGELTSDTSQYSWDCMNNFYTPARLRVGTALSESELYIDMQVS